MGKKKGDENGSDLSELLREINLTEDKYLYLGTLWREFGQKFSK